MGSTAAFQKSLLDNDQSLASQSERINDACYIYVYCYACRTKFGAQFRGHFHPNGSWCWDGPQRVGPGLYQHPTGLHRPLWSISVWKRERESSPFTLLVTPSFRSSHTEAPHGAKIFLFFLPLFLFFGFLLISLAIPLFRYRIGFTSTLVWPV